MWQRLQPLFQELRLRLMSMHKPYLYRMDKVSEKWLLDKENHGDNGWV